MNMAESITFAAPVHQATRTAQVRRLAYVAKALMTPRYRLRDRFENRVYECAVFTAQHPKLFRRAFVEASLAPPFEIRRNEGRTCTFLAGGEVIATLDAHGQLEWKDHHVSPLSLAPKNIAALAKRGLDSFWETLLERYEQLLDLPRGCLSKPRWGSNHSIPDARYWHPETQQALDATTTIEEQDRVREANTPLLEIESLAGGYALSKRRRMTALAIAAVKAFCAALTDEQRRALRRAQVLEIGHRELVTRITSRDTGARWLQALEAYPALLRWAYSSCGAAGITAAIERGLPLVPALASHFSIPEAAVRRFRGITPQRIGRLPNPYGYHDMAALRFIADLPPHLRPTTRADYRAAFNLYAQLTPIPRAMDAYRYNAEETSSAPDIDVPLLTRGMKRALGQERRIEALNGIIDVADSMASTFGWPRACKLFRSQSLGRLVELNVAWHRAQQQATRKAASQAAAMPEAHWPGLIPGGCVELEHDLFAVELTSMPALLQEGVALDHCVGGYYMDCYYGTSRIVSLRTAAGASRSTIEFQVLRRSPRAKPQLAIMQHYGRHNDPPAPEDRAAANALLAQLRPNANLAWPRLPCPESIEAFTRRVMQAHLTAFFHRWFGPAAADDTAQLAAPQAQAA